MAYYACDGQWDWPALQNLLPLDVCNRIVIKPPSHGRADFPCWNSASDGNFTLKSTFSFLQDLDEEVAAINPLFEKVWSWKGSNRYRAMLWKLAHGRLLTNEERFKRHMTNDNLCPRCQGGPETLLHMLRDCDEVQSFWQSVVHLDHLSRFFSLGTCSWLDWNMTEKSVGRIQLDWQLFFGVAVYELWRDRNSLVFSQESKLGSHLLVATMQQAYFIQQYRSPSAGDTAPVAQRLMQVVWKPLDPGWFKVNVDGSHWRSSGSTACGGLVRNEHGVFVAGFYTKLGSSTALWVELWALRLGIKLARQLHLHSVCFELDSEVVMRMV